VVCQTTELVGCEIEPLVDAGEVIGHSDVIVNEIEDDGHSLAVEGRDDFLEFSNAGCLLGV
jgi:hypothetical protein